MRTLTSKASLLQAISDGSAGHGYTSDLTSADPFLADVIALFQANPDPASWPPIETISGAKDVGILTGHGIELLHFNAEGVVSQASVPPTTGQTLPTHLNGLAADALPQASGDHVYISDLTSADPFLRDVIELQQENPDPASWPAVSSINGAQDVGILTGHGIELLHFNADGVASPASAAGIAETRVPAVHSGVPPLGANEVPQQSSGHTYTSDLTSADPFLKQVLDLQRENPDPATWPAIPTISGEQDVGILTASGIEILHFNADGVVSPSDPTSIFGFQPHMPDWWFPA